MTVFHLLSLDQNFTEIYPDKSNAPLTRTAFPFPSEFELPGRYRKLVASSLRERLRAELRLHIEGLKSY